MSRNKSKGQPAPSEIASVPARQPLPATVRLTPFTPKALNHWFTLTEACFRNHGVDDELVQFDIVLSTIPSDVTEKLIPWITLQGGRAPYPAFKQEIFKKCSLPEEKRAVRLLELASTPLGDLSPEAAWKEINDLFQLPEKDNRGAFKTVDLRRAIFLQRLPADIRSAITRPCEMSLEDLVKRAEDLARSKEMSQGPQARICQATEGPLSDSSDGVVAVTSSGRKKKKKPTKKFPNKSLCSHHRLYGRGAKMCEKPCQWTQGPKNQ